MLTKIWYLSPEQIESYVHAMDLGEPDEVKDEPVVYRPSDDEVDEILARIDRGHRTRTAGREVITVELYNERRAAGYSGREIAETYGVKLTTLRAYKSKWRSERVLVDA